MNNDQQQRVDDRKWELDFDQLSGREQAPDRAAEILQRFDEQGPSLMAVRSNRRRHALAAAAILVLGCTATLGVLLHERNDTPELDGEPTTSAVHTAQVVAPESDQGLDPDTFLSPGAQDPKPTGPTPKQVRQDPKPAKPKESPRDAARARANAHLEAARKAAEQAARQEQLKQAAVELRATQANAQEELAVKAEVLKLQDARKELLLQGNLEKIVKEVAAIERQQVVLGATLGLQQPPKPNPLLKDQYGKDIQALADKVHQTNKCKDDKEARKVLDDIGLALDKTRLSLWPLIEAHKAAKKDVPAPDPTQAPKKEGEVADQGREAAALRERTAQLEMLTKQLRLQLEGRRREVSTNPFDAQPRLPAIEKLRKTFGKLHACDKPDEARKLLDRMTIELDAVRLALSQKPEPAAPADEAPVVPGRVLRVRRR